MEEECTTVIPEGNLQILFLFEPLRQNSKNFTVVSLKSKSGLGYGRAQALITECDLFKANRQKDGRLAKKRHRSVPEFLGEYNVEKEKRTHGTKVNLLINEFETNNCCLWGLWRRPRTFGSVKSVIIYNRWAVNINNCRPVKKLFNNNVESACEVLRKWEINVYHRKKMGPIRGISIVCKSR